MSSAGTVLGTAVGLGPGHIVIDGDAAPSLQKREHSPPQFSAHVYCGQTAGWIKMPLGTEVGLGPGDVVLDGDQAPPKNGTAPQFSAHVCCGQTAGCIRVPVGTEVVGLGLGDIVRWGPTPTPIFVHVYCG